MWDKNNLILAINLLANFHKELWQLDRVADAITLENAVCVLKSQYDMLLSKETINE